MATKEALQAAMAAAAREEERTPPAETLVDLTPAGAVRLGGKPARPLALADLRILYRTFADAEDEPDPLEINATIAYCMLHPDPADLWRLAANPVAMRQAVALWMMDTRLPEWRAIMADLAPWVEELNAFMGLQGAAPAEKKTRQTGSLLCFVLRWWSWVSRGRRRHGTLQP
jgi:hypothetical protein